MMNIEPGLDEYIKFVLPHVRFRRWQSTYGHCITEWICQSYRSGLLTPRIPAPSLPLPMPSLHHVPDK